MRTQASQKNYFMIGLVFVTFFIISFITNIFGPLIPDIIESFHISLTLVALLPFSFFIAYGLMSIPAGALIEIYQVKRMMFVSFFIILTGSVTFALFPVYQVAIFSLFLIGIGMAMLQVAINPLLRTAGGEEDFAFNSVIAQLIFGIASFLSPRLYSYLIQTLDKSSYDTNFILGMLQFIIPRELSWIVMYWIFGFIALLMIIVIGVSRFPRVVRTEDERAGARITYIKLFRKPIVWLYFLGIFCYVGTEQGIANWISKFLNAYHKYDPLITGANTVSWFWGLLTAGCLLGLLLLKLFDSRHVLIGSAISAITCLLAAQFGTSSVSLVFFPLAGFSLSVMWSIIFSLALNSVEKHHGSFSGILCTGIAGGAIIPLIIGWLGDNIGLRFAMAFLYLPLGFILSIGFWANPIIKNRKIRLKNTRIKQR